MTFAEYCCERPLNPFWLYCTQCGAPTSTKRRIDLNKADDEIERMKRRHEAM